MVADASARPTLLGRLAGRAAWTLFVLAVAVAGAGLTLTLDHPQTDSGRPELTAIGDSLVGPRLTAMAPALTTLVTTADTLGTQSRQTYGDVRTRDTTAARNDLAAGDAATTAVLNAASVLQAARATLLDGTSLERISQANRARVTAIDTALTAAGSVPQTWGAIANAAVLPIEVVDTLRHHDAVVLSATGAARDGNFAEAVSELAQAAVDMDTARGISTNAGKQNLDTGTLNGLIARLAAYDTALVNLYTILVKTNGTVTGEAQAALDTVKLAEKALPTDSNALTIIVSDVGGQRMTAALIDLEQLRGTISAALTPPGALSPQAGVAAR